MTASTALPALTMISTLRGRARLATNSSSVRAATSFLPGCAPMNSSVTEVVRLKTATV